MFIGMGLSIWSGNRPVVVQGPPPPPPPPPGPLETINANGWSLTAAADLTGEFDPEGAPEPLTVTRPGFTVAKAATSVTDTVVRMKRLRNPNPGDDSDPGLTARNVALSDWIYAGDTVAGATNTSTRAYPRPVVEWMNPEWEVVTAGMLTLRLFVAHAYCRNGTPAACVEFQVTDGGSTVTALRAGLTTHTPALTGLAVPCYEATLDVSALSDGELTANAVVYPWVGDAPFDISQDGAAWPAKEYISVQKHYKSTGDAVSVYAFCDPDLDPGGADPASATASTLAAARLTGYAGPAQAIAALASANGNTLSGAVLVLAANKSHDFAARYDNVTVGNLPFRIIGEGTGATRAIYTRSALSGADVSADRLRLENVIIRQSIANSTFFTNRAQGPAHQLILKDCLLDTNGLSEGQFFNDCGRIQMIGVDSTLAGGGNSWTTNRQAYARLVGCANIGNTNVLSAIGCDNSWRNDGTDGAGFTAESGRTNKQANHVGAVYAYNIIETANGTNNIKLDGHRPGVEGIAIVGNIGVVGGNGSSSSSDNMEFYGAAPTDPDDQRPLENVLCMFNTFAGGASSGPRDNKSRTNFPGTIWWQIFWRGNVCAASSLQGDYDSAGAGGPWTRDGTQTRNWPARFGVVREYSVFYAMSAAAQFGYAGTAGDVAGLHSVHMPDDLSAWPGFAHDASVTGDNDHATPDYRIVDDSGGADRVAAIPRLPAGRVGYSVDARGTAIPVDGTALAGGRQGLA